MDYIKKTIRDFSACTQLVTRAFDRFGNCILVCQNDKTIQLQCAPVWRTTVFKALEMLYQDKSKGHITLSCSDNYLGCEGGCGDICFTACYIHPQLPELGAIAFGPYSQAEGSALFPTKPRHIVHYLVELVQFICRSNLAEFSSLPSADDYSYHVQRAIGYIQQRLPASVGLSETAEHLQIHKAYLCRIFHQETGMTFSHYINCMRVERSKILLANPSFSMLDVALAAGFNDQSYFSRIFKRVMQITPHAYRESVALAELATG